MARKRTADAPEAEPQLRVSPTEAATKIEDRIKRGRDLREREVRTAADIEACRNDFRTWDAYNIELLKRLFTTPKYAEEYAYWGGIAIGRDLNAQERLDELREDVAERIRRLESIRERLELIPLAATATTDVSRAPRKHTNRAFVVHGHDEAARETIARFLEKLGVEAVILHEQPTEGRTIVEKLEHYSEVDFAIVLLTPDDVGGAKNAAQQPRARQNVVLELGFFVGKLGRNHVCALYRGPLELPSDYLGVGYVALDSNGGWRLQLAKELRSAGFAIDMNLAL
jgi:predicted nucleotide-binding protein